MNVVIEKIVYPGKSMAKIDGKVIFTDRGLPGETVEISILKETKNYTQGRTDRIITHSPFRTPPRCKHYEACSLYQYIDYPYQTEIKEQQIMEIMARQISADLPDIEFRRASKIWGYRNKIKLKILWEGEKPRLAYNLPQTLDRFIPVDKCFLSPELTNSFLNTFVKTIDATPLEPLSELVVRENSKNELLVTIYHGPGLNTKNASRVFKDLAEKFPVSGLILIDKKTLDKTVLFGNYFFKETIENTGLYLGAGSFFQVNTDMLSMLIKDLRDNLDLNADKTLADLYCGVGTFGILLSPDVKHVTGVEADDENFFFMEKNIKLNNIRNFDAVLHDCGKIIDSLLKKKIDAIIVDPPRKGMDASICNALVFSGPPVLAYISCDPATLTRDLKILLSAYKIKNMFAYDFFPHTPHIETMAVLKRI